MPEISEARIDVRSVLAKFREVGVFFFLLGVVVVASAIAPRILSPDNLRNILLDIPLLLVVAMGMTLVILSRNIDVSVGSMLGLCGMVVGLLFKSHPGFPILAGVVVGSGLGLALGAFNGALVTWMRVPAIIATLATLSIYRGITFIISGGKEINAEDIPPALIQLSQKSPVSVPWIVLLALLIAMATHLFLRYWRLGREIYAVGGNPTAARLRGIPVNRVVFLVFTLTGGFSGLAGVMYASRYAFVNPGQTGVGFELSVIAATVIGGTDVFGGSGSVLGTTLGCLLLCVLNNALIVTGLSAFWQLAVYGAMILIAVITDALIQGRLGRTQEEAG